MHLISMLTKRTNWVQDAIQSALDANGVSSLTRGQLFVIANVAAGEKRAADIARNLGISRQAVSQIIAELVERDFIDVREDPQDRRVRIIVLKSGLGEGDEICSRIFQAIERELMARIGSRRLKNLYDALDAEWGEPPEIGALPDQGLPAENFAVTL
ncbi:MarR family winged helix-turn-helix transcriptional regulator [Sphingobium sp. EM0848]|uniref:MarR family winged helix-turn-helix transcriptional regulator n=1 Tax=Sphingobium sp. EM0848 TaxID=2743473 RepID=UPI00159C91A6|nr:MarR family transcriptional regulator [Sphingobium sp. EM0848]